MRPVPESISPIQHFATHCNYAGGGEIKNFDPGSFQQSLMDALLNVRVNHLNNRRVPVIIIDDPQMETIYTSEGKFTAAGAHFFHLLLELHSRSLASVFILSCKEDILWPIIEQLSGFAKCLVHF